jgi:murein DD-endopeptidase MepM/ murein hydrolase activator NlpD
VSRRSTFMPADVSIPHDSYLGVFRRRRTIAVGAAVISFLTITVHDLPASAATIKQDAYTATSQKVTVPADRVSPIATRDAFTVTVYTPVQWPIAPSSDVSSGFGWRVAPCSWGCSSDHQGVDFDPGYGSSIHAVAEGRVVEAAGDGGLGQHLVIEHRIDGQMVQTVYGHMIFGSQTVGVGDTVAIGQVIGRVGSTGASTGPHLHFEVRPDGGDAVEPLAWLATAVTEPWKG